MIYELGGRSTPLAKEEGRKLLFHPVLLQHENNYYNRLLCTFLNQVFEKLGFSSNENLKIEQSTFSSFFFVFNFRNLRIETAFFYYL